MEVIFTYASNTEAANAVIAENEGKAISAEAVDVRDSGVPPFRSSHWPAHDLNAVIPDSGCGFEDVFK